MIHIRQTDRSCCFFSRHPPYVINYPEHLGCFMQLCNKMTVQVLAFPQPGDLD